MTTEMLRCEGCASGYDDTIVIRDISLTVEQGMIFGVLGKNGMGKSTLLKTIMGFLKLEAGAIHIAGEKVNSMPPQVLARRGVSYVQQENAIFQDMTVAENLRLSLPHDRYLKEGLERIAHYFPVIPQRLRQTAGTLSGGEQKMLLMSRAMITKPKLVLIDEISEGLQPTMVDRVGEALKRLREEEGATIFLVEQNVGFVADVCDRIASIKIGSIVETRDITPGAETRDALLELMRI